VGFGDGPDTGILADMRIIAAAMQGEVFLVGELQSHWGGPDSFAIGAAQPQEVNEKNLEFSMKSPRPQKTSCAFGTPIAKLSVRHSRKRLTRKIWNFQ
jgi:hypothetical protein